MEKKRILLVEDDASIAFIVREHLLNLGSNYEIGAAFSAEDALRQFGEVLNARGEDHRQRQFKPARGPALDAVVNAVKADRGEVHRVEHVASKGQGRGV